MRGPVPWRRLAPAAASVLIALGARLLYGPGAIGYDAAYSLLWGHQIATGHLPEFESFRAPTPHPLSNLVSVLLAPLPPATAEHAVEWITLVAFGAFIVAAYLLGARLFSRAIGALLALILL